MPASARQRSTTAGGAATLTPSASNTSALPHRLDTERLPCLATRTPQRRDARAPRTIEMLNVPRPIAAGAARVEHVGRRRVDSGTACARIVRAKPDDLGRPLALHAPAPTSRPAICAGAARAVHDLAPSRPPPRRSVRSSWRVQLLDAARETSSAVASEEVAQDPAALAGQDRLRDGTARRGPASVRWRRPMIDAVVLGPRRRPRAPAAARRRRRRASGSATASNGLGDAGEDAAAVVLDRRRLAVHRRRRAHDRAAERGADRLVPEADAENRRRARRSAGSTSIVMPASSGRPGPGEITMRSGAQRARSSSTVTASLRTTRTSAPSSPRYWTRL